MACIAILTIPSRTTSQHDYSLRPPSHAVTTARYETRWKKFSDEAIKRCSFSSLLTASCPLVDVHRNSISRKLSPAPFRNWKRVVTASRIPCLQAHSSDKPTLPRWPSSRGFQTVHPPVTSRTALRQRHGTDAIRMANIPSIVCLPPHSSASLRSLLTIPFRSIQRLLRLAVMQWHYSLPFTKSSSAPKVRTSKSTPKPIQLMMHRHRKNPLQRPSPGIPARNALLCQSQMHLCERLRRT